MKFSLSSLRRGGLLLLAAACGALAGCKSAPPALETVIYTADSGPILPELQWHERITIGRGGVRLERSGKIAGSRVNAGSWALPAEPQRLTALFESLAAVDCSRLERVETQDAPDGGGAVSYTLVYHGGAQCSLQLDPGVTYTHGEDVSAPVQDFLRSLEVPAEAASRHS